MPRLWDETIEAHRQGVRGAILEAAIGLVSARGLRAVTMSEIAEKTGIGRATLYKYFSDVEAILVEWHRRQVSAHLAQLEELREQSADPAEQLNQVLEAYAFILQGHPSGELAAELHRTEHVARAEQHLTGFLEDLITEAARKGVVRGDTPPVELASYCVNALGAARSMGSKKAVRRLLDVTLAGLRPGA